MAEELKVTYGVKYTNGNAVDSVPTTTLSVTQTLQEEDAPTVSIGTSEQDVAFADLTTLGWVWMRNLDLTNYVDWGPKSGGSMVGIGRLQPGEVALFRLKPGITLRMVAHTAACKVQFKVWGN